MATATASVMPSHPACGTSSVRSPRNASPRTRVKETPRSLRRTRTSMRGSAGAFVHCWMLRARVAAWKQSPSSTWSRASRSPGASASAIFAQSSASPAAAAPRGALMRIECSRTRCRPGIRRIDDAAVADRSHHPKCRGSRPGNSAVGRHLWPSALAASAGGSEPQEAAWAPRQPRVFDACFAASLARPQRYPQRACRRCNRSGNEYFATTTSSSAGCPRIRTRASTATT